MDNSGPHSPSHTLTLSLLSPVKDLLSQLDPAFDHRNRLGIMTLLVTNECVDYNTLRTTLQLTDGNLASHLKPLETNGYIDYKKLFIARRPQTTYTATELGRTVFQSHLNALEALIKMGREEWNV